MTILQRFIGQAVRLLLPYGCVRRVLRGPVSGYKIEIAPAMGVNYWLGGSHYPFGELLPVLRPGMTVFDIGANRGQMSLFFAGMVGAHGRVVAFEPVAELAEQLRRNLALNHIQTVQVIPVALGNMDSSARFHYSDSASTQGRLSDAGDGVSSSGCRSVEVRRLDALTNLPSPDLLKVDVEGGGFDAFLGARETLARSKPAIYFELHNDREREAVEWCRSELGYRVTDGARRPIEDFNKYRRNVIWLMPG